MAGQIKRMIDEIIVQRSKSDPALIQTTRTKLYLKGIAIEQFNGNSPDDSAVIAKVKAIAGELGVHV